MKKISTLSPGRANPATPVISLRGMVTARMFGGIMPINPPDPALIFAEVTTSPFRMGTWAVFPTTSAREPSAVSGAISLGTCTILTIFPVIFV